jgi:hypothetical protein
MTLYGINKARGIKDLQEKPLEEVISKEYHEFLPLFSKAIAETLPPHDPTITRLNYRMALPRRLDPFTACHKNSSKSKRNG